MFWTELKGHFQIEIELDMLLSSQQVVSIIV